MEDTKISDTVDTVRDDTFSIVCGDLGLGTALHTNTDCWHLGVGLITNGNIVNNTHSNTNISNDKKSCPSISELHCLEETNTNRQQSDVDNCSPFCEQNCVSTSKMKIKHQTTRGNISKQTSDFPDGEPFPTYADVPYGTSLRQQKQLFEQNISTIFKKHNTIDTDIGQVFKTYAEANKKEMSGEEIDQKLLLALQEINELKMDLDVCHHRLDAKYQAIAVLQKQSEENKRQHQSVEQKVKEASIKLAKTLDDSNVVVAQCDISVGETPRETLQRRYLRVCQENSMLMSTLEARTKELGRVNAQAKALGRERDELLALLDIKERAKYKDCHSQSQQEEYDLFSTTELAVLEACRCRVSNSKSCGCAYAAANLMRETCRMKEECKLMQKRRSEAYVTVDAYRIAFEEQLQKSRTLTHQLASIATTASRTVKTQAAIKWLIQVLADQDYQFIGRDDGHFAKGHLEAMTLPELVTTLSEMLQEKNETLAHQKLAAQVLAARVQELENRLQDVSDADGDVSNSK